MYRILRSTITSLAIALCVGAAAAGGSNPEAANGGAFLHIARANGEHQNLTDNGTLLGTDWLSGDVRDLTNWNPNAVLFVTHNTTYTTANVWQPFGVEQAGNGWEIINQSNAPMLGGEAFNVQVQHPGDSVFVHTATPSTIVSNWTAIDHPLLNNNPGALLSVTQRNTGVANNHHIGVFYSYAYQKWAVFNQDLAPMPVGAAFNVQVLLDPMVDFEHVASTIVSTSKTEIDHPLLNNRPNALVIVTPNWADIYNNNPIGIEYDNGTQKWRIVNTNGAAMPNDAHFFVHIASIDFSGDGVIGNGGFEVGANNKSALAGWDVTASGKGSKRVCNTYVPVSANSKYVANTGECAFRLKGEPGQTRTLSQKVSLPNIVDGQAVLSMWLKAKNVSGLKIKAVVKNVDGTKTAVKLPASDINGTYNWQNPSASRLLPPGTTAKKLNVKIILNGTGKLFIDDVYARVSN